MIESNKADWSFVYRLRIILGMFNIVGADWKENCAWNYVGIGT